MIVDPSDGTDLVGIPLGVMIGRMVFFSVFFCTMVLMAKGWCITRYSIPFYERRVFFGMSWSPAPPSTHFPFG